MKIIADISLRDIDKLFSILDGFDDFSLKYLETNNIKHEFIYDADILLVRSQTLINEKLLLSSNIKWIGSATAGIDHIDIKFLESKNINWFNAQGCNAYSVCNYVLSSLYELKKDKIYKNTDMLGIVGYGNIGKRLKSILDNLNIKNVVYDPFIKNKSLSMIDELLKAEIISIHVPLTFDTKYPTHTMINESFLNKSKCHSVINTSRGGIVSESSVIRRKLNYIADVWENEPSVNIDLVNYCYIATPHIAGHSFEGKVNGTIDILIALMRYLNFDESTVNKNLKIIEGFYPPPKNYYLDLKDFNNNYDISKESKNFKDLFKKYPQNNFNKIRACHPKRHDLSVYNI